MDSPRQHLTWLEALSLPHTLSSPVAPSPHVNQVNFSCHVKVCVGYKRGRVNSSLEITVPTNTIQRLSKNARTQSAVACSYTTL